MYADDTQFLDADYPTNIQALKSRIESSLSVALRWFTQNDSESTQPRRK